MCHTSKPGYFIIFSESQKKQVLVEVQDEAREQKVVFSQRDTFEMLSWIVIQGGLPSLFSSCGSEYSHRKSRYAR